jgi:hypothetical protein
MEDLFLMKSKEFYQEYQHIFEESPSYFSQFLKSDYQLLQEILPGKTNIKLQQI